MQGAQFNLTRNVQSGILRLSATAPEHLPPHDSGHEVARSGCVGALGAGWRSIYGNAQDDTVAVDGSLSHCTET